MGSHNINVFVLYVCAGDKIEKNEIGGECRAYGEEERWGNLGGKRPVGRHRRRWEDNIKMDLQVVGCEVTDWIELAQDRDMWRALVNVVMNLRVP